MKAPLPFLLVLLAVPAAWQLAIWCFEPKPAFLPPPAMVAGVLWTERSALLGHTLVTLGEAVLGYAIANVFALGCALFCFHVGGAERVLAPWLVALKNVPFPTVASILVVVMGDSLGPKLIVVVLVTFFPILANLNKGLKTADPVLIDRLRTLHATRWQIFRKAAWPAAIPFYLAAHEIAFTGSIIAAIVAEWLFAQRGLGFLIVQASTQFRTDRLFAVTIVASVVAMLVYGLVGLAERRVLRWQRA